MTSSRVTCLLALALLLSVGWQRWHVAAPESGREGGREVKAAMARPSSHHNMVHVDAPAKSVAGEATRPAAMPAATLNADASAVLAEHLALQQRMAGTGLELTPEQWTTFADVSLHFQAVRHAYEATIATATAAGEGAVRMEIPAYPRAGDALRARFFGELKDRLGAEVADDISRHAAAALEGHFGGFGVGVQTLEFVREAGGDDADYTVTRTVRYWNAATDQANSAARLTTRREVHFPGLEDPSGYSWGPFLSVMASPIAAKAGS